MNEITNLTYELQHINNLPVKNKEDLEHTIGLLKDANDNLQSTIKKLEKRL